jgi:hypothetical protein
MEIHSTLSSASARCLRRVPKTRQPFDASDDAAAAPIPEDAPVIRTLRGSGIAR